MRLRIATFNLENFDETAAGARPALAERIALMKPQVHRLDADIICFQEVNGQNPPGQPRTLLALAELLEGTSLEDAFVESTKTDDGQGEVFEERNLVVVTRHEVKHREQLRNKLVDPPMYQLLTAIPPATEPKAIRVERPILHVTVEVDGAPLHIINVHLKSKIPFDVPGQKLDRFTWRTAEGAAEGSFISSMMRMSQALEVGRLVDAILTQDPDARIVAAGDFNAEPDEVPVLAIRGQVEETGNGDLAGRVLAPIENSVPEPSRYTLFITGKGTCSTTCWSPATCWPFIADPRYITNCCTTSQPRSRRTKSIPSPTTRTSLPHSTFPNLTRFTGLNASRPCSGQS